MDERPDVVEICDKYTLNYWALTLRLELDHENIRNRDLRDQKVL
jgi:hypothetical protein